MHHAINRPAAAALLAITVAVVAAGCGGGEERVAVSGTPAAEPTTTSSLAPAPSSTAATVAAAPPSTSRASTTRPRPSTTTTKKAPLPKVVVARQGDRVVAVFVATGSSLADPSFSKAKARLTALGYRGYSGGDTSCSQGAKEALPQLEEYSLSLEFATRAEADRFSALYGPVLGTAGVTVFCAD